MQATAAINSYNDELGLATHERLCTRVAQPHRAFLQLTISRNFCGLLRGAGESGSIGGTQLALALGHCHTGVGRGGPAPSGRGKRPRSALALFMARPAVGFYAD
jgi:hypothetical protein